MWCLGPGPAAYKLKTLVGREDHCKTKVQAPAYSIGIPYKCKLAVRSVSRFFGAEHRVAATAVEDVCTRTIERPPRSATCAKSKPSGKVSRLLGSSEELCSIRRNRICIPPPLSDNQSCASSNWTRSISTFESPINRCSSVAQKNEVSQALNEHFAVPMSSMITWVKSGLFSTPRLVFSHAYDHESCPLFVDSQLSIIYGTSHWTSQRLPPWVVSRRLEE